MSYKVPFIKPDFPNSKEVADDYGKILESNWYTNFGPFEREFAQQVAAYIGSGYYASTFNNATSGLLASVLAVFGKGDGTKYIIMPSFTFAAGAHALLWCGYRPLLIDIEESGLHMDIHAAETALNDSTLKGKIVGILFCNAFGTGSLDITKWETLAEKFHLPIILDSAAGFGSLYAQGKRVGSAGTCEIFSFHATKPFSIGEGGAVVSRDENLIASLNSIQNFGFRQKGGATQLGFNGKLQEINAAIGLRQFKRFYSILKQRREVFRTYVAKLDSDKFGFQINADKASLCFATIIVKDAKKRDVYLGSLLNAGVQTRTYYNPSIHKQDYFQNLEHHGTLKVTEQIDNAVLSLPIHDNMNPGDLSLIIDTLNA